MTLAIARAALFCPDSISLHKGSSLGWLNVSYMRSAGCLLAYASHCIIRAFSMFLVFTGIYGNTILSLYFLTFPDSCS